jgi:RecB family exonuclease
VRSRLILDRPDALELVLRDEVRRLKGDDPLAPVTILVGNTLLRPYLRLKLAGLLGGWINIDLLTFADLAEKLGEMPLILDGRLPVPPLAERVISRQVARGARGYLEPVAEAPGFGQALQRLFGELRQAGVTPGTLEEATADAGGNEQKLKDLAAIFERYERGRAPFYDATDALGAANVAAFDSRGLIVHGVWHPTTIQRTLLEGVMSRCDVTFLLPRTGTDADVAHEEMRAWLAGLGVEPESSNGAAPASSLEGKSVQLLSAPDAPREVVEAARACLNWARAGIRFDEMAVAYRHDDPYRALIESVFDDSGIPIYLHDGTPLVERPLGRRALALLDLIDAPRQLLRSAVMDFLTDAELPFETWDRYGRVFSSRWDAISRKAGIVEGREQWVERLQAFIKEERERAARREERRAAAAEEVDQMADSDEPGELETPEGVEEGPAEEPPKSRRAKQAERLLAFITDLANKLEARPARASWSAHVAYLADLFSAYIRDIEPILDTLASLAQLDDLPGASEVSFEQFRHTARDAITEIRAEDPPDKQRGQFARQGVNVLDVNSLRNLSFKAVAILGLAERSFPPPPRQDALLLDHERTALNEKRGWDLPLRAGGPDAEPLQFALATHAATESVQLSFARTEMADGRAKLPSHFFRAAAATLTGKPVSVEEVDSLPADRFRRVPGSRFAAPSLEEALTPSEYDRTLLREQPELGFEVVKALRPQIEGSRDAHTARWRTPRLTVYDGVLTERSREGLEQRGGLERTLSASSLESYAECPYRYFLRNVLGIKKEPEPDRIQRLEPMERGSLVHDVLERFLTECGDEGQPSAERRERHLRRLFEIADEECDERERRGLTGLPVLWRHDRHAIREDLARWYDEEIADEPRFDHGRFELAFGFAGEGWEGRSEEPLEITSAGVRLHLHGYIDRVNWKADDSSFRVIDYKTGRGNDLKDGSLKGGRALQLPIYLLAASRTLGIPPERGSAEYFYVTTRGGFKRVAFAGTELAARREDFEQILETLATGIAGGDFHPVPGEKRDHCRYCDFYDLCDARVEVLAERKADDPKAGSFAELAEIP